MKKFKNSGWQFWDKMELANPGQTAGGQRTFSPLVDASQLDPTIIHEDGDGVDLGDDDNDGDDDDDKDKLVASGAPSTSTSNLRKRVSTSSVKGPVSSSSRLSSHADSSLTSGIKSGTPSMRVMIHDVSSTVQSMIDTLKDGFVGDRTKAISTIQTEEGFSTEDIDIMINVFSPHINLAETYLASS